MSISTNIAPTVGQRDHHLAAGGPVRGLLPRYVGIVRRIGDAAAGDELVAQEAIGTGADDLGHLRVGIDDRPLSLEVLDSEFVSPDELRTGMGTIRIHLRGPLGRMSEGTHELHWENCHLTNRSVYLVNALLPRTAGIRITKQHRNETQSRGTIEFMFDGVDGRVPASRGKAVWVVGLILVGAACGVARFVAALVDSIARRRLAAGDPDNTRV